MRTTLLIQSIEAKQHQLQVLFERPHFTIQFTERKVKNLLPAMFEGKRVELPIV